MSDQKEKKYFHCKPCREIFETTEYIAGKETALCPICGQPAPETTWRVANLALGWDKATGPKTPEGKARVRLNGFKHGGRTSIFTTMAPAKPGKYPQCADCELTEKCKSEYKYCPMYLDTLAKFIHAYKEGQVKDLREIAGLNQGQMQQVFQMMIHHVMEHGVMNPKRIPILDGEGQIIKDKNGKPMFNIEYIKNNLLKELPAFQQSGGFDALSQDMTPKTRQESEELSGFIKDKKEDRETMIQIKRQSLEEQKKLREVIKNMNARKQLKKFEKERDEQATNQAGKSSGK